MATTKLWAVRNNLKRVQEYALDRDKMTDLKSVLDYAKNSDKTEHQYYMTGINCSADTAYQEFSDTKAYYGKEGGLLAYHGYMSFRPGECTADEAMKIGTEFAKRMWGDKYQVVVSVHLNTECLHCHFVVNSVSFKDGTKLRDNEKNWNYFKHTADDICRQYGKSTVEGLKTREPTKRDKYVKDILDYGLNRCGSIEELEQYLLERGHKCQFDPHYKYWTITPKGWTKPYRIDHLEKVFPGTHYSKEAMLEKLAAEPDVEVHYEEKPDSEYRQNKYFDRQAYIRKYHMLNFQANSILLARLSSDVAKVCGLSGWMPLTRCLMIRPIMPFRPFRPFRELGTMGGYKNPYQRFVDGSGDRSRRKFGYSGGFTPTRYEVNDEMQNTLDRVEMLAVHNINSEADLKRFLEREEEELKKLREQKKLLENRSKVERTSYDTGAIDKRIGEILKHKKLAAYYQDKEEKEHGSSGRS